MKKVITALDNSEINEEMKTDYDIVCKDISYKEGIIEQIESNKKVDIIIFDERLDGNIELADLIRKIKEKIKKIEIIIITSNKNKVIQKTKRYKRIKIYETNKIKIKKLKEIIDEENQEKKEKKIEIKKNKNILTISGSEGVGKTVISIIISKLLKKDNLLIEYNIEENYDTKIIFNNKLNKINYVSEKNINKIKNIINKEDKKNIIIDIGRQIEEKNKEYIAKNSNQIIVLLEANIIGIKNCKKIVQKLLKIYSIDKDKIFLIINKKNYYSIDTRIIKNIFKDIKIIGEIEYDSIYDKFINNEFRNVEISLTKKEKRNYKQIIKNIF